MIKRIFIVIILILFSKSWQLISDGFRVDKIETEMRIDSATSPCPEAIFSILNQKFHYLGKGCQVYVFESQDKQYVLKFIRYHKYKIPFWISYLSSSYYEKRLNHRKKSFYETMRSYKIAYDYLREETGLLFMHISKEKPINKKVVIVDRIGREKTVDLDRVGFLIQKKVVPLEKSLIGATILEKQRIVDSFLETLVTMCEKGFIIKDYNCVKNSGWLEKKVVFMDLGSFFPLTRDAKEEMTHFVKYFKKFTEGKMVEIAPYFDEQFKKVIAKYEAD